MAVPLLMRTGILENNRNYINETAKQIINFNNYLFDKSTKLYKHGWFGSTGKKSKVYWGRANGWIIWAESDALLLLPESNPYFDKIKSIFIEHMTGLLNYQDNDGMWHQVLNDKTSFEETSCTAMFIIGLSRAIREHWMDKKYLPSVKRAWKALQKNISNTGVVKDICRGTGIGSSVEFYKTRKRFDNDPRGIGAVIVAGIEMQKLYNSINLKQNN